MLKRKRFVVAAGVTSALAVLSVVAVANLERLIAWQVRRAVIEAERLNDTIQAIPEGRFELLFCGTGTPRFSPDRGQSCLAVVAGGRLLLFDAGMGAARQLRTFRAPTERLEAVFLTHLHSDHAAGLGDVLHDTWHFGRDRPVDVVGPPGTLRVHRGFLDVFAEDEAMRRPGVEVGYGHKNSAMGRALEVRIETGEAVTVYDRAGLVVKAFRVDHPTWRFAYGYRIDFAGKSVVVSGDTAYTPAIVSHGRGADVLVHEAMNVEMMEIVADVMGERAGDGVGAISRGRLRFIESRHTPTDQVARVAREAGVKMLVVTHLTPPIPSSRIAEYAFIRGMGDIYDGPIRVARDGMRLTLVESGGSAEGDGADRASQLRN
ncbi:MAG: MBL fold metallo-hydrolase [Acidobacteriota bacterium]